MTTNVALVGLARDLAERARTGKPIRIGLIGAGEMGTDIVTQVARMPGIEVGALSARNLPTRSRPCAPPMATRRMPARPTTNPP